jgi:hypothetical protein
VLIVPDYGIRRAIMRNFCRALPKGGVLVLVVPSLESALYTNARQFEWNIKDGMSVKNAMKEGLAAAHKKSGSIGDGLINIEGVTHKHYLREELELFVKESGFKSAEISKVEYGWGTEFEDPPRWMKEPYPWDWLAVVKK